MPRICWVIALCLIAALAGCSPNDDPPLPNAQALKLELQAVERIEIPAKPPELLQATAQAKPNLNTMYRMCKDMTGQCIAARERSVKICKGGDLEACRATRFLADRLCNSANTCVDLLDKLLAE